MTTGDDSWFVISDDLIPNAAWGYDDGAEDRVLGEEEVLVRMIVEGRYDDHIDVRRRKRVRVRFTNVVEATTDWKPISESNDYDVFRGDLAALSKAIERAEETANSFLRGELDGLIERYRQIRAENHS